MTHLLDTMLESYYDVAYILIIHIKRVIMHKLGLLLMTCVTCVQAQIPHNFTTQRIRAERVTSTHTKYLTRIVSDPKVQAAYNSKDEESFTDVASQVSIVDNQWQQYGYGLYILFDRETSECIGFAGYHTVTIDEFGTVDCFPSPTSANELEFYILFMSKYWRQGYGFEVTSKLIELAFAHVDHESIIAYIQPHNYASLGLIKKLNFKEEHTVTYNNKLHVLYRLQKQKEL